MTPEQVDKLIAFGQMALEQGWYSKAREYLEQVLELDASNQKAIDGLARIDEILRREGAAAPIEAEVPTEPPLAKRISDTVDSALERIYKKRKERADRIAEEKELAAQKKEETYRGRLAEEPAWSKEKRLKRIFRQWEEWEERRRKEEERRKGVEEEERQRREQREKSRRDRERTNTEMGSKPGDKSPYDVLNIQPNATREEIVEAYRRMAQMYHPDKVAGLGPEFRELAEEHMKAINAAYAILGNPDRRAQYDRMRQGTEETRSAPTGQDSVKVDLTIIVSEDEIVIGGRKMTLPCSLDTLSRSIGAPSRVFPNPDTNNVYVWDELGIYAYERPGAEVTAVSLRIGRRDPRFSPLRFSPKNFYGGSVQIGSYVLNAASDEKDLRAEGFIQNGVFTFSWQRWLGKFNLLIGIDQSTQKIASLDISVQDGVEVDSTIIVLEDEIVIGWRKMTLPCSLDTLSRSIGTPSRMFRGEYNVYVWDELGINAYERPGAEITVVLLRIGPSDPSFRPPRSWPKNFYGSFVQIGSYVLTVASDAKDLRAAGFIQNGIFTFSWQRWLGKFNLFVETNRSTQRIASLEISV